MIWFSCKQCGQTHGQLETSAGATIFCACGASLLVPWESTAAAPPVPPPVPDLPPALQLEPVTFDPVPSKTMPSPPPARGRKRARLGRRESQHCFNHQEVARQTSCADCGESFCDECVVPFQDAALCGPCKNYRVKNLQRALPLSRPALVCLLSAVLTGPLTLGLLPLGHPGFPWWSFLALLPQGVVAGLALFALRKAEQDPKTTGRSLALTGLVSAGVTTALIVLLTMYTPHLWT